MIVSSRRGFLSGLGALLATPAVVRADILMPVRSIARFVLPGFHYDSFDDLIGQAESFQWVAGDWHQRNAMIMSGWEPVPAYRFNDKFDIKGSEISYGDCTLMQRPRAVTVAAQKTDLQKANDLVASWISKYDGSQQPNPNEVNFELYGARVERSPIGADYFKTVVGFGET